MVVLRAYPVWNSREVAGDLLIRTIREKCIDPAVSAPSTQVGLLLSRGHPQSLE
jgi:hypothetical protein